MIAKLYLVYALTIWLLVSWHAGFRFRSGGRIGVVEISATLLATIGLVASVRGYFAEMNDATPVWFANCLMGLSAGVAASTIGFSAIYISIAHLYKIIVHKKTGD